MKPTTKEKLNEWRALLEERKQTKLTIKKFCQEKNITPAQFYYYQEIIKKPTEVQEKTQAKKIDKENIKPIQIINSALKENNAIRFILPNSLQCILPRDISSQEIKMILEIVMSC